VRGEEEDRLLGLGARVPARGADRGAELVPVRASGLHQVAMLGAQLLTGLAALEQLRGGLGIEIAGEDRVHGISRSGGARD
jgi:hypothetical protein